METTSASKRPKTSSHSMRVNSRIDWHLLFMPLTGWEATVWVSFQMKPISDSCVNVKWSGWRLWWKPPQERKLSGGNWQSWHCRVCLSSMPVVAVKLHNCLWNYATASADVDPVLHSSLSTVEKELLNRLKVVNVVAVDRQQLDPHHPVAVGCRPCHLAVDSWPRHCDKLAVAQQQVLVAVPSMTMTFQLPDSITHIVNKMSDIQAPVISANINISNTCNSRKNISFDTVLKIYTHFLLPCTNFTTAL